MDRRKFITGCLYCASLAALTACSKREADVVQKKNIFGGEEHIGHIDIHLTEHCNLQCRYCSHFSSIAEEEYYDVNKFEKDMARLSKVTEGKIANIQLLGGEPLLHPKINEFFYISRKYFPKSDIDLLTNGLLLDDKGDDFWEALKDNDIYLCPSLYPVHINWKSVLEKADKHQVNVFLDGREVRLNLKNINKNRITHFYKLALDLNGKQQWNHGDCRFGPWCANFIGGKLYPCFVISNIRHFNKKFGKKLVVTPKDYIDVYKAQNLQEVLDFLNKKLPVPFCKYCAPVTENLEWENVQNHTIDEWTLD